MYGRPVAVARRLLAGAATVCLASVAIAYAQPASDATPGATVEELLAIGRQMSPELAARGLEAEAALARIEPAGTLPDPVFRTEFEEIDRRAGSLAPDRLGMITYTLMQEFPLWGKRELRRDIARSEADGARGRQRAAEVDLTARIKTVFANYYAAHEALGVSRELARNVNALADVAQQRYARGLGGQAEAIRAELGKAELTTEIVRLEAERRKFAAHLNALINRPSGATLAAPRVLRPLPSDAVLRLPELLARAQDDNPMLATERSEISAASHNRRLVEKSWYPDVTLGVAGVDRDRRFSGYEAMVEVKIPIQGDLRREQAREAAAKYGAAQSRLEATRLKLQGELEEAFWGLDASKRILRILHETHIPQAKLAFEAALRGYETNRVDFATVLESEQRLRRLSLEHLKALVEQQSQLAEIERLVGSEL